MTQEEKWNSLYEEINQLTDGLGWPVDEGIKECVTALQAYQFPTTASCEGHIEGNHGSPHPWINISVPKPLDWQDDNKKQEMKTANLKLQESMIKLLEEFYQDRNVPYNARLILDQFGFGEFSLQSLGANVMKLYEKNMVKEQYQLYQKEMQDFGLWLKNKFLAAE